MLSDVIVIGGGAAGLATAIFAARYHPTLTITVLDGAKKLGAKILVSGGGRCNVTNVRVTPDDFRGGSRNTIRRVLAAFGVDETVQFFREIGVSLHEEEHGKLFPDSNSAATVLSALLDEARRLGVRILTEQRITRVDRTNEGFAVTTHGLTLTASCVVLATGGKSLPKTGSDGGGYTLAESLGHTIVPTTPALAPLILEGEFHQSLSGIAHDVELTIHVSGDKPVRQRGALLWTHFGISGPVVLDASRFWHAATLLGKPVHITASMFPGETFETVDQRLIDLGRERSNALVRNALSELLPARFVGAMLASIGIQDDIPMGQLARDARRKITHALTNWRLPVRDSRGYTFAEVTAGGVPLTEIDPATMQSRKCPGLFLVGEILDVDGRIGGFNFQWAWSSAFVAGQAMKGDAD